MQSDYIPGWSEMTPDERIQMMRLIFFLSKDSRPMNRGTFPDPLGPDRDWVVATTSIMEGWILLQCRNTKAYGALKESTIEEWSKAHQCHTEGLVWHFPEYWRVTLLGDLWK
jgi:hypothetical protein